MAEALNREAQEMREQAIADVVAASRKQEAEETRLREEAYEARMEARRPLADEPKTLMKRKRQTGKVENSTDFRMTATCGLLKVYTTTGREINARDVKTGVLTHFGKDVEEGRVLIFAHDFNGAYVVNLAMMSTDELNCMKQLINEAVEEALPIAQHKDEEAMRRMKEDGITDNRLFRGVPTLSRNDGTFEEYREGIRFRPQSPAPMEPEG